MVYSVREIYYTLQGEGVNTGRAAVFCRFSGCNLWSGREADRAGAVCRFCDTEFVGVDGPGGGKFDHAGDLAAAVAACWPAAASAPAVGATPAALSGRVAIKTNRPLVVCTGGEPLLQLDAGAVTALHAAGFEVAIETNGTRTPPPGIDWICVSPKVGAPLTLTMGHELKLVYPQAGGEPEQFASLEFQHFFLQPMDGPDRLQNTRLAIDYCLAHPQWRLSLQTHKLVGLP
ncbi:MAG: 7-carboxy-7-deazaguanine synthase [Capsulimonadaceae bacterium]